VVVILPRIPPATWPAARAKVPAYGSIVSARHPVTPGSATFQSLCVIPAFAVYHCGPVEARKLR